jgi:hypothetical protein
MNFEKDQIVECIDAGDGNTLTTGKQYRVVETAIGVDPYELVTVIRDDGKRGEVYARRFRPVTEPAKAPCRIVYTRDGDVVSVTIEGTLSKEQVKAILAVAYGD